MTARWRTIDHTCFDKPFVGGTLRFLWKTLYRVKLPVLVDVSDILARAWRIVNPVVIGGGDRPYALRVGEGTPMNDAAIGQNLIPFLGLQVSGIITHSAISTAVFCFVMINSQADAGFRTFRIRGWAS